MGDSTGSGEVLGAAAKDFSQDSLLDYNTDRDIAINESLPKVNQYPETNEAQPTQPTQLHHSGDNFFDNGNYRFEQNKLVNLDFARISSF